MSLQKATISVQQTGESIEVQFNPTEYTLGTTSEFEGKEANIEFKSVSIDNFTVNLFFDTYEQEKDVRTLTKSITDLMQPTVNDGDKRVPPICMFAWGRLKYTGVITNIQEKYTMFLPSGEPVRGTLQVTFQSVLTPQEMLASMGKPNCLKLWQVKMGERLDIIANTALRDASQWRAIATYNGIANPLGFPTASDIGKLIFIPDV